MTRRENKTSPMRMKAAERRRIALEMRIAGAPLRVIAKETGMSVPGVHKTLTVALSSIERVSGDDAAKLREITCERLDQCLLSIWKRAMGGDLKAIDRVLAIEATRHRVLGTSGPQRIDLEATVAPVDAEKAREKLETMIQNRERRLIEQLNRCARSSGTEERAKALALLVEIGEAD